MKKTKTVTVYECDQCGADCDYGGEPCLRCGKRFCTQCYTKSKNGTNFAHDVYFQGSGDGFFCTSCEEALRGEPSRIYSAYVAIKNLQTERTTWEKAFDARRDAAVAELKAARRSRKPTRGGDDGE